MNQVATYIFIGTNIIAGVMTFNLLRNNSISHTVRGEIVTVTPTVRVTPTPKPTEHVSTPPMVFDTEKRVEKFLKARYSPMKAKDFMDASQEYGIDVRVLVAIGQLESGSGKHCFRPYNAFGLMTKKEFKSYRESIFYLADLISRKSDGDVNSIAWWYNPGNHKEWAKKVKIIMREI